LKCPRCSQKLLGDEQFCPGCGAPLEEKEAKKPAEQELQGGVTEETAVYTPIKTEEKENSDGKLSELAGVVGRLRNSSDSLWAGMTQFSRGWFSALALVALLLLVGIASGRTVPTVVALVQLLLLAFAMLAHKLVIPGVSDWVKIVAVVVAVLLTGLNAYSYSLGTKSSSPAAEPIGQEQVSTEPVQESTGAEEETPASASPEAAEPEQEPVTLIKAPFGAADCSGKKGDELIAKLGQAGFTNVKAETVADLDYEDRENEGTVSMVSIGGRTNYAAGELLDMDAPVVVTLHTLMEVKAPFSGAQAVAMDPVMLRKQLQDAGFGNLHEETLLDIDPDDSQWEYTNEVTINGDDSFLLGDSYRADAEVSVVTHKPFEKYTVNLSVNVSRNMFFSTYSVEVAVDGEVLGTVRNGGYESFSLRLRPGTYTVTFSKSGDGSVSGTMELNVYGDMYRTVSLSCRSDSILVK